LVVSFFYAGEEDGQFLEAVFLFFAGFGGFDLLFYRLVFYVVRVQLEDSQLLFLSLAVYT